MSKSALLKSSIAKKYWMALTGLFLCLFLVGHLLGNLQLFSNTEEGRQAFNEYGYFMGHNIFIKIMSYLTYASILFHAIDGFLLTRQNIKARPIGYAKNNAAANSSSSSRNMALLGSAILIFIVMHMANFWWKVKVSDTPFPLHTIELSIPGQMGQVQKQVNVKVAEGYKDLHSLVYAFFGHDKSKEGFPTNDLALFAVIGYVLAMIVLAFHLNHGFGSAFQSLGLRHPKYTNLINLTGKAFSFLIPLAFAIIPVYIYLTK